MLESNSPNVENLMGKGMKPTDSDAAISTAVAEHTQFHDYVQLRDAAMAHLTREQREAVEKRIEEWRPASQAATPASAPAPAKDDAPTFAAMAAALTTPEPTPAQAPAAASRPVPPGFKVWR
jgi:hypothetical protein